MGAAQYLANGSFSPHNLSKYLIFFLFLTQESDVCLVRLPILGESNARRKNVRQRTKVRFLSSSFFEKRERESRFFFLGQPLRPSPTHSPLEPPPCDRHRPPKRQGIGLHALAFPPFCLSNYVAPSAGVSRFAPTRIIEPMEKPNSTVL